MSDDRINEILAEYDASCEARGRWKAAELLAAALAAAEQERDEARELLRDPFTADEFRVLLAWGKDAVGEFGVYGDSNFTRLFEKLEARA
jgi:hypothetical protein